MRLSGILPSRANIWWSLLPTLWTSPLRHVAYAAFLKRFNPALHANLVTPETRLVVEGFPRSANTFLVQALQIASDEPIAVAHHLHDPIQIDRGMQRNIPVVIIVRDPLDAFTSFRLKFPTLKVAIMHRMYMSFYRHALERADALHLVRYEDVIGRPEQVIAQIRRWLGLAGEMAITLDQEAVFAAIDEAKRQREGDEAGEARDFATSLARPTAQKEALKHTVRSEIARRHAAQVASAQDLYRQLLPHCRTIEGTGAGA